MIELTSEMIIEIHNTIIQRYGGLSGILCQAKAAPPENLQIYSLLGIEEGSRADRKQNALHETGVHLRNCRKLRARLHIICCCASGSAIIWTAFQSSTRPDFQDAKGPAPLPASVSGPQAASYGQ